MEYTISNLANLSGVSTRTLRYYDAIGLLKPHDINASGYRIYTQNEVDLLQQIIFYRELDVPLKEINTIINQPSFDQMVALEEHYDKLMHKRNRLDTMLSTIEKTISSKKGVITMTDQEKFEGFKAQAISQNEQYYGEEIRNKYGNEVIDNSNEKFKNMSKAQYDDFKNLEQRIGDLLQQAYQTGDPSSAVAQELVATHKQWLLYTWPSYSTEAHIGLAELYIQDSSFTAYYERYVTGGAQFLRDAIVTNLSDN